MAKSGSVATQFKKGTQKAKSHGRKGGRKSRPGKKKR